MAEVEESTSSYTFKVQGTFEAEACVVASNEDEARELLGQTASIDAGSASDLDIDLWDVRLDGIDGDTADLLKTEAY